MLIFLNAKKATALEYYNALQAIHAVGRVISSIFEKYDVVMLLYARPAAGATGPLKHKCRRSHELWREAL